MFLCIQSLKLREPPGPRAVPALHLHSDMAVSFLRKHVLSLFSDCHSRARPAGQLADQISNLRRRPFAQCDRVMRGARKFVIFDCGDVFSNLRGDRV